ncbi:alpha/beta fold hydrolase [Micromonospora sp. WMMD714]|uniref:alpha/beta fold hydrolase n=1 Tax=Micromonospora sp. WMMD714 TaxID=3016097 RepID=UPI002499CCC1|nr:alpha/beta fold hydrolase [Micromonospora sp. WMMD714]WFE65262.1 alpha/beta fold hydrolase [Micromonospora sp. WMMD714]
MASVTPDWIDRKLYPFRHGTRDVAGHRLHYVDEGDGPTLLLLHGNPTWSFVWRNVIARLAGEFRFVAPDLPGFGLSEAPAGFDGRPVSLAAVIEQFVVDLDLTDVVLVAQDWGGPIGLRVAERRPDRFTGLVLGNTWAWPVTGDRHFARFSALMGGPVGRWWIRHANLCVNLMIPAGHRRRSLTRDEMRHYRAALATPERRQASAVLPREIVHSAPFLADVESDLPLLRDKPALLLWADRDIAFRRTELDRWRRELPDATVVELAGAGHYLQSDAPAEFADALRTWHRAVTGARGASGAATD